MKKFILLLFSVSLLGQDPKSFENNSYQEAVIDSINRHLQTNYFLPLFKNFILTGQVTQDPNKFIGKRAYTDLKIEF